jgi:hypothetical protein
VSKRIHGTSASKQSGAAGTRSRKRK